MHNLLFFEFIGTSELLVVLVVALIIFGPRKLPELGRSLGQALSQFKNASDDFKRTWETEVQLETVAGKALAPAASAEYATDTAARQELVPDVIEAKTGEIEETHAHEATAPGLPYVNHETALGEA
jgi:TatA/E family protein of Tat protein translocase